MSKYKVGDKVRIREDLEEFKVYGGKLFTDDMTGCAGNIATIVKAIPKINTYVLDIDDGRFYWTEEMFDDSYIDALSHHIKVKEESYDYLKGQVEAYEWVIDKIINRKDN